MSKYVEKRLDAFLEDDDTNVILIKGGWGTGKTHFLREYIKNKKGKGFPKTIKDMSITSLFGVSNKAEIYSNIISSKTNLLGNEIAIEKKISWLLENSKRVKAFGFSIDTSNMLGFFKPKNSFICFDDFERIGTDKNLALEFTGLVSELKENGNCKIVIISNTEEVSEDVYKIYKNYKEKIIDDEIEFTQNIDERIGGIFSSDLHIESVKQLGFTYGIC